MPDLTATAIADWLSLNGSNAVVGGQASLDADPAAEPLVLRFGDALDRALGADAAATEIFLGDKHMTPHLRSILVGLGSPRRLRMMHWLVDSEFNDPRALIEGIENAPGGAPGEGLRPWLLDLQRRELLETIFNSDRINMLLAACRRASGSGETA
jgi:hypothetical protein